MSDVIDARDVTPDQIEAVLLRDGYLLVENTATTRVWVKGEKKMTFKRGDAKMNEPIVTTQLTPKSIKLVKAAGVLLFIIGSVIMIVADVQSGRTTGAAIAGTGAIAYIAARMWAWWKVG